MMSDKLSGLLTNKWFDTSKKYRGEIEKNGTFRFKPERFISISPMGSTLGEIAYLKGHIERTDNGSIVHITISPNLLMVLMMFGLIFVFLAVCFTDSSMVGGIEGKFGTAIIILLAEIFFYSLIYFYSLYLKNAFENAVIGPKKEYKMHKPNPS
jgi:hypothetical protein